MLRNGTGSRVIIVAGEGGENNEGISPFKRCLFGNHEILNDVINGEINISDKKMKKNGRKINDDRKMFDF